MKSLFYRLFGAGKISTELRAQLQAEEILLLDEGIKSSVTFLDFRAPGSYSNWRRQWFIGSLLLTRRNIAGLRWSDFVINVLYSDPRLSQMRFAAEADDRLLVAFNAGLFQSEWSGKLEYRFRTPLTQEFLTRLHELAA